MMSKRLFVCSVFKKGGIHATMKAIVNGKVLTVTGQTYEKGTVLIVPFS